MMISLFIPGIPKPGGSKTATLIRRKGGAIVMKNGRPLITTRDDAKGNAEWKQQVAFFAGRQYDGPLLDGLLSVTMVFYMPRPKGHYRANGELHAWAPVGPPTKPDCLKLARSTEDALTGVVWKDDNATIDLHLFKRYAVDRPGAQVMITDQIMTLGGKPAEQFADDVAGELFAGMETT